MKKNYQKPEIIEEIELDRKVVFASPGGDGDTAIGDPTCSDPDGC